MEPYFDSPIHAYILKNGKKFSVPGLINAHSRLSMMQFNKGNVSYDDILQTLRLSLAVSEKQDEEDLEAHGSLLYEAILVPCFAAAAASKPLLQMKREIIGNEGAFVQAIVTVMKAHCGENHEVIEEFEQEVKASGIEVTNTSIPDLNSTYPRNNPNWPNYSSASPPAVTAASSVAPPRGYPPAPIPNTYPKVPYTIPGNPSMSMYPRPASSTGASLPPRPASNWPVPSGAAPPMPRPADDYGASTGFLDIERQDPIVRLLAQIRKYGMDVLFPQSIHDKVLACIFVAITCASTPVAHRELIELAMIVKESGVINNLEHVSKTKVRGVLAILKQGDIVVTHSSAGEAVRLYLAAGIVTYNDLRDRHDRFMARYLVEHHIYMPEILRNELIWQVDHTTRQERLQAMDAIITKATQHFAGFDVSQLRCYEENVTGGGGGYGDDASYYSRATTTATYSSAATTSTGGPSSSFQSNELNPYGGFARNVPSTPTAPYTPSGNLYMGGTSNNGPSSGGGYGGGGGNSRYGNNSYNSSGGGGYGGGNTGGGYNTNAYYGNKPSYNTVGGGYHKHTNHYVNTSNYGANGYPNSNSSPYVQDASPPATATGGAVDGGWNGYDSYGNTGSQQPRYGGSGGASGGGGYPSMNNRYPPSSASSSYGSYGAESRPTSKPYSSYPPSGGGYPPAPSSGYPPSTSGTGGGRYRNEYDYAPASTSGYDTYSASNAAASTGAGGAPMASRYPGSAGNNPHASSWYADPTPSNAPSSRYQPSGGSAGAHVENAMLDSYYNHTATGSSNSNKGPQDVYDTDALYQSLQEISHQPPPTTSNTHYPATSHHHEHMLGGDNMSSGESSANAYESTGPQGYQTTPSYPVRKETQWSIDSLISDSYMRGNTPITHDAHSTSSSATTTLNGLGTDVAIPDTTGTN